MLAFSDRGKCTTPTVGTGPLTLSPASAQHHLSLISGREYEYVILDPNNTSWESGIGTFTDSGSPSIVTLTRAPIQSSNDNAEISISAPGATVLFCPIAQTASGNFQMQRRFISGCIVTKAAGSPTINAIDVSAGEFFDPSTNKIVSYAGGAAISIGSPSPGATQFIQVYGDANGIQVEVNANPPSACYAGFARMGGTGGNKRWLGWSLSDASGNLVDFDVKETASGQVESIKLGAAQQPLGAGTQTSFTAVSFIGSMPRYVCVAARLRLTNTTSSADTSPGMDLSIDGVNISGRFSSVCSIGGLFPAVTDWSPIEPGTPQVYYRMFGTGATGYIEIVGSRWLR